MSQREACVQDNKEDDFSFTADDCIVTYLFYEGVNQRSIQRNGSQSEVAKVFQQKVFYDCFTSSQKAKKCKAKSTLIPTMR
jgi:hypothetical protein